MNLLSIAWKSVRQRRLASGLTALSVALGVMLMVIVLVISDAVNSAFSQRTIAYHLIVGPKGSDLQLVLSAVYRIQPPIENLPYMYLNQLREDPRIISAVPLAFGDVTEQGAFPIVGTTTEYFENEYTPGRKFTFGSGGKPLSGLFDAVIGSEVARQNSWNVGSKFTIKHGGADSEDIHDEQFTVVAVVNQTGTPNDRSVFLNLEGFYAIEGHAKPVDEAEARLKDFYANDPQRLAIAMEQIEQMKAHEAAHESGTADPEFVTPDAMKEVTAVFVLARSDYDAFQMQNELRKQYQAMAVNPIIPIQRLLTNFVGHIQKALMVLTGMIIAVSGICIFVSIYNSMSDRRREIGIMRALGASRTSVFSIILSESAVLCIGGGVIGWLIGHTLAILSAPYISTRTGLLLNPWALNPWEVVLFPVLLVLAALVGFLPAMTAYRTNVADALHS